MGRDTRKLRGEEGMTYVFVAFGFMAFLGASMLAIDVGMLMTARAQAQNSADAGALAGATALARDDYDDRSATGPAVTNALLAARLNQVMAANVDVKPSDVRFLNNPAGLNNRVQVTVYRTAARGNPLSTLIARYFGMATAGVGAVATAEASPANAEQCVKPFTIPDRWREVTSPPFDSNNSTFDAIDNKGRPLAVPDVYIGPDDISNYTGYDPDRDKGTEIILKANNQDKIAPSFYNPYDIPGSVGANDYRWNIANCNTTLMHPGDLFNPEPGNMVGPTRQGMEELIAKDPNAYWDTLHNQVVSSLQPSPRVVIIPLFDPFYYATGKQNGRNASLKFVNYLGFFVEEMQGNEVWGRITPVAGLIDRQAGPPPPRAFPYAIRLVQ
jgi:Flp pilus assembly protein TadG